MHIYMYNPLNIFNYTPFNRSYSLFFSVILNLTKEKIVPTWQFERRK